MHVRGTGKGGGLEQAKRECLDRERYRHFFHGHLLGRDSREIKVSET